MALTFSLDLAPEAAVRFFRKKGLRRTFSWQDIWQEEHDAAFTVAKMMDIDLLRDVRDAVDYAIAKGETFADFRRKLEPELVRRGWWGQAEMLDPLTDELKHVQLGSVRRLETIFRTNMQMAYSAGDWEQITETADSAPYLMYDSVDDNRVRPAHKAWDGMVLRWDDPWWATHHPPNGWSCRCSTIQLSDSDLRIMDKSPGSSPPVTTREFTNRRTGEITRVPDGIDPGFAYNPGASRIQQLQQQLADKQKAFDDGR